MMRIKKKILIAVSIVIFVDSLIIVGTIGKNRTGNLKLQQKITSGSNKEEKANDKPVIPVEFFDEKTFYDSLIWLKNNPKNFPECAISSAVVPHHLLAGFMPEELFSRLASQHVETVIIIGPNHWERGGRMLTSDAIWKTPFGELTADDDIISDLKNSELVEIENEIMAKEHSTTGLFPMIYYYLPKVKVIPIILSAKNNQEDIKKLFDVLEKHLKDEKTALVLSVDFSHYLSQNKAEKKDRETLDIIRNFNYQKLFKLNNDNLDSPSSIAAFLLAVQKISNGKIEVIDHSNSADILGGTIVKTTSYFSLAACR